MWFLTKQLPHSYLLDYKLIVDILCRIIGEQKKHNTKLSQTQQCDQPFVIDIMSYQ